MRKLALAIIMSLAAMSVAVAQDQAKGTAAKEIKATRLSDMELDAITAGAFTQTFIVISNRGAADVLVSKPHHATCINQCFEPSTGKATGLIFVINGGRSSPFTKCIHLC